MLNTGFSEITQQRLTYTGENPWYVEIAITGKCNFNCKYCNRFKSNTDLNTLIDWMSQFKPFNHIQITGGEPTIHPQFEEIIHFCKEHANIVGVSTNGSWDIEKYLSLPIDKFSISFDDYDLDILKQRGYNNPEHILEVIKELSKTKYVNIGLVIDDINNDRAESIIDFILGLGVHDIKLSVSTKSIDTMPLFTKEYNKYPILSYRVNNFKAQRKMRGFPTKHCHIAKNDVTIVGDKHYPCLVYFREHGKEIGSIHDKNMMVQRMIWSSNHDCLSDPICSKYCMDFKCDFNAAYDNLKTSLVTKQEDQ